MSLYTNILSIAGSDPSGCAGVQADIMTGLACGVHVATALTAVTVQNTERMVSINAVSPDLLRSQIEIVASDIPLHAIKIGLLPDSELADVVIDSILKFNFKNIVIDPVGAATVGTPANGDQLFSIEALHRLLPLAKVITPNLQEAAALLGDDVSQLPVRETAYRIHKEYEVGTVIVTGGDSTDDGVRDGFYCGANHQEGEFFSHRIDSCNTHGSGCSLSTAIASFMALGFSPIQAAAKAERLIHKLISAGKDYSFSKGNYGPLGFIDYFITKEL